MRTRDERQAHRDRMRKLDEEDNQQGMPPFFTEASDGQGGCGKCHGRQFAPPSQNIFGGRAWLQERAPDIVMCFTCGTLYTRGISG